MGRAQSLHAVSRGAMQSPGPARECSGAGRPAPRPPHPHPTPRRGSWRGDTTGVSESRGHLLRHVGTGWAQAPDAPGLMEEPGSARPGHRPLTAGAAGGPPRGPLPCSGGSGPHGSRADGLSPHPWAPGSQHPDRLDQRECRGLQDRRVPLLPRTRCAGKPEGSSGEV